MLLRVRGSGASSENSQAVLMSLRGFRHQKRVPREPLVCSAANSGITIDPFDATVECSHGTLLSIWKELWNLYDIAYDGIDDAIVASACSTAAADPPPLTCVYHILQWSDADVSRATAAHEASAILHSSGWTDDKAAPAEGVLVLLVNASRGILSVVWQLAYVALLSSVARKQLPIASVAVVGAPTQFTTDGAAEVVSVFLQYFVHALLARGPEVTTSATSGSIPVTVLPSGSAPSQLAALDALLTGPAGSQRCTVMALATDQSGSGDVDATFQLACQRAADVTSSPVHIAVAPVHAFIDSEANPASLMEHAAMSKENMVLNFCPCCGHTDSGTGCGASHHH